jgi:hypothetical protein
VHGERTEATFWRRLSCLGSRARLSFRRTASNGCPVRCPRSDEARHASPIWVPAETCVAICWSCDPRCDVVNRCSRIDPVRLYWHCKPQWLVVEQNDNGKPVERRGRKASGLRASQPTTAGPPKVHAMPREIPSRAQHDAASALSLPFPQIGFLPCRGQTAQGCRLSHLLEAA